MAFVKLAETSELSDGQMVMKEHGEREILLAQVEGKVYAIDNICPHQDAPLDEGTLGDRSAFHVTCPWHDAHFDIRNGKVAQDTDWAEDIASFKVEMRDDGIYVDV